MRSLGPPKEQLKIVFLQLSGASPKVCFGCLRQLPSCAISFDSPQEQGGATQQVSHHACRSLEPGHCRTFTTPPGAVASTATLMAAIHLR